MYYFLNFSCRFLNPNYFSNLNYNCWIVKFLDLTNLQEQVKKALFWPFTVWKKFSSVLKNITNFRPTASNFESFSRSLELLFHSKSEQFCKQNNISICSEFRLEWVEKWLTYITKENTIFAYAYLRHFIIGNFQHVSKHSFVDKLLWQMNFAIVCFSDKIPI